MGHSSPRASRSGSVPAGARLTDTDPCSTALRQSCGSPALCVCVCVLQRYPESLGAHFSRVDPEYGVRGRDLSQGLALLPDRCFPGGRRP